ncbi:MAG: hypothetical protein RML36_14980 [Anaerolineae bacterium]|nr:hypothetical protein [Anaerolineae bacterium]MDW8100776.1 hypothetical protein [Anaerolineae bacterium]
MINATIEKVIPVWGFSSEELAGWPADLKPVPTESIPAEGPVVVHVRALAAFRDQALAHPHPDGRLAEAILYLPRKVAEPKDAWMYFDAVVEAGDWEALRRLTACPRQFKMAEWAEAVPAERLEEISRELESWGAKEQSSRGELIPALQCFGTLARDVPWEIWGHLAECEPCRWAFVRGLRGRLSLRWMALCPPITRLAAHARGQADPWVEAHLPGCAACRGEMTALRQILQPAAVIWLAISLARQEAQELAASLEAEVRRQLEGLAALLNGFLGAGMILAGGWTRARGVSGPLQPLEFPGLLDALREGRPLTVVRAHRELELRWLPGEDALRLEALRGEWLEPVRAFRVELRRGEAVLWQAESQDGGVTIPLAKLEEALAAGADALAILVPEGAGNK